MRFNITSIRLAFILIALLFILILLSAIIPQKDISLDRIADFRKLLGDNYRIIEILGLDEIYTTPFFFILLGLLAINLTAANIKRFKIIWKTEKTLIKARHLGSILFHFSLIIIIIGVILNFLYKFNGIYGITEGQTVRDNEKDYFRIFQGPLRKLSFDRFVLTLEKVFPDFPVDESTTGAAEISITNSINSFEKLSIIRANAPFKMNNLEFHFGQVIGYSPKLEITDSLSNIVFNGFVRVALQKRDTIDIHADFIELPQLNMLIDLEIENNSPYLDSTALHLSLSLRGRNLFDSRVLIGQVVEAGEYKIGIPEIRRWCYINVIESPFLNLIFFGFWSALAGLSIGFIGRTFRKAGGTE